MEIRSLEDLVAPKLVDAHQTVAHKPVASVGAGNCLVVFNNLFPLSISL